MSAVPRRATLSVKRRTPISSLANLIGAQLYLRDGGSSGPFWKRFLPVSFLLFAAVLLWSLAILRLPRG